MMGRAAYLSGVKLWDKTVRDDLAEVVKKKRENLKYKKAFATAEIASCKSFCFINNTHHNTVDTDMVEMDSKEMDRDNTVVYTLRNLLTKNLLNSLIIHLRMALQNFQ